MIHGSGNLRAAVTLAALSLCSCAVGPNYKPPPAPQTSGYTTGAQPDQTAATAVNAGESQSFHIGADLPGNWWALFESPQLNALVDQAMANYPDIAAQQAALRAARENVRAQQGVFVPQVQANFNQERAKISGASIAPGFPGYVTNLYQGNVTVAYTLDVFGAERRQLEGLQAQLINQNFVLEGSFLTLTSNVAATAIQLASAREQILATNEIIDVEEKELTIIRRQFELGTHTRADVLQQQSNLASVRATLPGLEQQRAAAEHQLAVLTGQFPHDATAVELTLAQLKLPEQLPLSLPSALVAQRPDIRQQEAQLHQASAAIGLATANMLPQITLNAAAGDESLLFASLFKPGSGVWDLASAVTAPIFQGGTLRAKRRAAIDAYEQAAAQYRLTVLNAFQNVADTLTALGHDAETLRAEADALDAAKASLDLIQRQYDAGAVNYVSLLTAQQLYQNARIDFVRATASRFTDTITLFQALGGGWWNRSDAGTLRAALSSLNSPPP
jgi:NodT family efflux transporter outer membrane factor (OMF) lipoprotein